MRAVYVRLQATVPMLTVVVRQCDGVAGMGMCGKNGLDPKIARPSGERNSLPVEGELRHHAKRTFVPKHGICPASAKCHFANIRSLLDETLTL